MVSRMNVAERGMGLGLRALGGLSGLEVLDRTGLREPMKKLIFRASRDGFRTATVAGRAFSGAASLGRPARQRTGGDPGLFDLTPTDEQEMLQEAFGEFAAARLRPVAEEADRTATLPDGLDAEVTELGATMLGIPEQLGGALEEASAVTSVLVAERLAHGDLGLAFALLAPAAVATALSRHGDADQQARYVTPFAGEDPPVAALALLEDGALADPLEPATTAERTEAGGYVLRGAKALVPRAAAAEVLVVSATLDGLGRLFVVEAGEPGLSTSPEPAIGLRAAQTAALHLDGVELQAHALVGGDDALRDVVRRARLAWCALAVGCCQAVLDHVIPYVQEREAFGEAIADRQAVAFMVADISVELEGLRMATYRAASSLDAGRDAAREIALARQLVSDKAMRIGSDGVQLLGGHGYVHEYPEERWYRDLRAAGTMEGALLV